MKRLLLPLFIFLVSVVFVNSAEAAVCTPTGMYRDGINMTAALINPKTVSGQVDATGCNIGVYYGPNKKGTVDRAEIFGANYFGVVNHRGNVTVKNSKIHNIGEVPFNGSQHGIAIYFANADFPNGPTVFPVSGSTKGIIEENEIWDYQKGGIVVNFKGSRVNVEQNKVTGLGPVSFIAQNGIQFGYGAKGSVTRNVVSANQYTGNSTTSGGILIVGGPYYGGDFTTGINIERNELKNNDVGVSISQYEADLSIPSIQTKLKVHRNNISNDALTNGYPYQAGISDVGNKDSISRNKISGDGYSESLHPGAAFGIDLSYTTNPKLRRNDVVN